MKFTMEYCFIFGYTLLSMVALLQGRYVDERDWLSNVMDSLSRSTDGTEGQGTRNVDISELDGSNESEHESVIPIIANMYFPAHLLSPVEVDKRKTRTKDHGPGFGERSRGVVNKTLPSDDGGPGFGVMFCCGVPLQEQSKGKRSDSADTYLVNNQFLSTLYRDILNSKQYKERNYDKLQRSPANLLPWQSSISNDWDNLYKRGVKRDDGLPLQSEVHPVKLLSRTG